MRRVLAGALLLLAAAGCGDDGRARLVVSAAASMRDALTDCARDFGGVEVRLQFGGSDELAAQIRQGVTPDVYAAANTALPAALHAEGRLERPLEFASNELVLAVPRGSAVASLGDLTADGVTLAVGSESVPVGAYTRATLAKLPRRRERAILANIRTGEPEVTGIVGKLTQRAVDAGFVYATDVAATDGALKAIALPEELDPDATYAAGVVEGARQPEEARAFLRGLVEGACADALREAGFGPAPSR